MANVLYLTHRLPYPPDKGDKVRTYHLLEYLTARHRVFLGTFVDDPADLAHVATVRARCADIHVTRIRPTLAKLRSLSGLATVEALSVPYYRDEGLRAWIRATCAKENIDAAMIFSSAMAQYNKEVPAESTLQVFDDVDSAKWTQYSSHHHWPMSWLYRREGRLLLEFERAAAAHAARTFFVTESEAVLFCGMAPECAERIGVVPNGVDSVFFSPVHTLPSPFAEGERTVVFTGAMDYWPNIDGVEWFVKEVLPRLRTAWPSLRFHIVGRSPAASIRALASADIKVSGTVPDVRPYLKHADVVVAPLRLARGIQNKILEAMAMGKAVVASNACAGALDATAGSEFLAASGAAEFADQVDALLREPARADAIGTAARAAVAGRYSWAAHLSGFDRYLPAAGDLSRQVPSNSYVEPL